MYGGEIEEGWRVYKNPDMYGGAQYCVQTEVYGGSVRRSTEEVRKSTEESRSAQRVMKCADDYGGVRGVRKSLETPGVRRRGVCVWTSTEVYKGIRKHVEERESVWGNMGEHGST